jgi:hypothetical protein
MRKGVDRRLDASGLQTSRQVVEGFYSDLGRLRVVKIIA